MNHSYLIHTHARAAMAAREVLSIRPRAAIAALSLLFLMGLGVLGGIPSALGQEQKPTATSAATSAVSRVNINSADAQTLASVLKGVGDSRAQEIVRYRETYGPFASAEELTEVKGIGKSTLDQNRDVITLD
jgi:competence protein ComEA